MRLRTVSCREPGWRRVRHGRRFRYLDAEGGPLDAEAVARVKELVIPPAWTDVWICPHPRGHLQAVGTDDAGRRQYLYHPQWRVQRDLEKFDRVASFAGTMPQLRRKLRRQMRAEPGDEPVERRRVLAAAVRLIDLGCFRPGSESSAEIGSHGLTTLERRHVRRDGDALWFRFHGKADIEHEIRIDDPDVVRIVLATIARRRENARVLATKVGRRWSPITAEELNERIRELAGAEITAKDFRTWHATTTAAASLAATPLPTSKRGRATRIREAMATVAEMLGNTPAVAKSAYVDPRVVDLFHEGVVLDPVPTSQDRLDRAVADLLDQ